MSFKYCSHCGREINDNAWVCRYCGCTQKQPMVNINHHHHCDCGHCQPVVKDKWISLLLCFFLGVFGIHKFYERKIALGILYLFTGGLCGVGVVVDFIMLLFKPRFYY